MVKNNPFSLSIFSCNDLLDSKLFNSFCKSDKLKLESEIYGSWYFPLIASILGCHWYLCTVLRIESSIPFAANIKFFGVAKSYFGTIVFGTMVSKHSIKTLAIFWSSEITILLSIRVIVLNLLDLLEKKLISFPKVFIIISYFINFNVWIILLFSFAQDGSANISLSAICFLLLLVLSFKKLFLRFDLIAFW